MWRIFTALECTNNKSKGHMAVLELTTSQLNIVKRNHSQLKIMRQSPANFVSSKCLKSYSHDSILLKMNIFCACGCLMQNKYFSMTVVYDCVENRCVQPVGMVQIDHGGRGWGGVKKKKKDVFLCT